MWKELLAHPDNDGCTHYVSAEPKRADLFGCHLGGREGEGGELKILGAVVVRSLTSHPSEAEAENAEFPPD